MFESYAIYLYIHKNLFAIFCVLNQYSTNYSYLRNNLYSLDFFLIK